MFVGLLTLFAVHAQVPFSRPRALAHSHFRLDRFWFCKYYLCQAIFDLFHVGVFGLVSFRFVDFGFSIVPCRLQALFVLI